MALKRNRLNELVICLIFTTIFMDNCSTFARNLERYDTAYECEGRTLKIECPPNEVIRLIRANYGRFSITICNEHGDTDWSVNCMSPRSFRVLYNKCNSKQNCSIIASTSQFGDPCPNTLKYLEAHYQCAPVEKSTLNTFSAMTTTIRPSQSWFINPQSSILDVDPYPTKTTVSTWTAETSTMMTHSERSSIVLQPTTTIPRLYKKDYQTITTYEKGTNVMELEEKTEEPKIISEVDESQISTLLQAVSSPPHNRQHLFPVTSKTLGKSNASTLKCNLTIWLFCISIIYHHRWQYH
ncbi:adhesion G protein-coupled receptor L1-like isoform X1 [Trichogramma pretiosum]|uniref:adhesion G protein-coupled receptor L1-like isoform X1 n=1 Tax=Trichogramma pretiosum TaxID=7493 RepID=UPI0006C94845|nr:adhesion G protein-coupled receptor L1-like isoform X1 [Trichogramma pretiosum]XP_014234196.1 adhesion G protein-coupled receptor L1-like isoform X1 [Trichogramma pretiosum]XP_014234205.1 adhesion G protein-coupled receptor L1-like isoform X1 [Trichogramma pretiosum]